MLFGATLEPLGSSMSPLEFFFRSSDTLRLNRAPYSALVKRWNFYCIVPGLHKSILRRPYIHWVFSLAFRHHKLYSQVDFGKTWNWMKNFDPFSTLSSCFFLLVEIQYNMFAHFSLLHGKLPWRKRISEHETKQRT